MKLHEDTEAFSELVQVTAEGIGLPQIYVEKDYWITKGLKHLSESPFVDNVVFKGGTSLSKAYRLIDRFSEDIDLAILARDMKGSAQKKLIKKIETVVSEGLIAIDNDVRISKGSNYRKTVYQYPRSVDNFDFGQASPELLVEVNAFSRPEPFEKKELQSFVSQMLSDKGEAELINQYELEPFVIKVLSVRRTLVEKVLGVIKDSYDKNPIDKLSNRIRHLYDICLVLRHKEHQQFVQNSDFMDLCRACIIDEEAGYFGSTECYKNPLSTAPLFLEFEHYRAQLEGTYKGTFSDLIYGELPEMDEIEKALKFIQKNLKE